MNETRIIKVEDLEMRIIESTDEEELTEIYEFIKKSNEEELELSKIHYSYFIVANEFTNSEILEEIYKNFKNEMDYELFESFIQNEATNLQSYIIEELFNDFCKDNPNWKKNIEDYEEVLEYFFFHFNTSIAIKEIIKPYLDL